MRVQELDESYTFGHSKSEVYEKVLSIDRDIRSLKSATPKSWWVDESADFSGDHLIQFWHYYMLVRSHVHYAMSSDEHDQYTYSRTVCAEACQSLAQRYGYVRRHLPPGFFVCRIIDMQVFTAAIFLILSCYGQTVAQNSGGLSSNTAQNDQQLASVQYILNAMESVSGQVSSEFAQEAAAAIRSLMTLLANSAATNPQDLTLRVPLLGKIHIAAKQHQAPPQRTNVNQLQTPTVSQPQHVNGVHPFQSGVPESMIGCNVPQDTFPWYMELDMNSSSLQDPFIINEIGDWGQWMGESGMNFPI